MHVSPDGVAELSAGQDHPKIHLGVAFISVLNDALYLGLHIPDCPLGFKPIIISYI